MTPRSIFSCLLLLTLAACGDRTDELRLGMAGPFGASFGLNNRRGAELAVEEINAKGGIGGRRLVVDYRDDAGDGAKAATIAQEFVDDLRVSAVIGHVSSGAMVAAAKVYDGFLTAVATTASSPEISGISPWVFRVISSDSANAVALAAFAQRLGKQRAAILYENDAYGRGLADGFRRSFSGEVILFDPIDAAASGAAVHVEWLAARQPDLVFVAGTEASGLALLREARRQGFTADFLGGDGWTGVAADPVASQGALVGAPFTPLDPRARAQQFVAAYRARFDEDPDANAALAYDASYLLAAALADVGPDRVRIREWLAGRRDAQPFQGVTGDIAFHPSGDPIGKSIVMTRLSGGRPTLAEDRP